MGILDIASGASVWRGYSYYKSGKVLAKQQLSETKFTGTVSGSNHAQYEVFIDIEHPRNRTATVRTLTESGSSASTRWRCSSPAFRRKPKNITGMSWNTRRRRSGSRRSWTRRSSPISTVFQSGSWRILYTIFSIPVRAGYSTNSSASTSTEYRWPIRAGKRRTRCSAPRPSRIRTQRRPRFPPPRLCKPAPSSGSARFV